MATTDVVLSFYASKSIAGCPLDTCSQPTGALQKPAVVSPRDDLRANYQKWSAAAAALRDPVTKRLLPALLRAVAPKLGGNDVGRVAVVGFSEGVQMVGECLRAADDRLAIDTVIDLDGLHMPILATGQVYNPAPDSKGYFSPSTPGLGPWLNYGLGCQNAERLLVNWHTAVPTPSPKVTSTTEGTAALYGLLQNASGDKRVQGWSTDVLHGQPFDPPARTPAQNDAAREWTEMPDLTVTTAGNCFRIGMPGNSGGAHIFSCHWGQAAIWRALLVPRWNGSVNSYVDVPQGQGQGSAPEPLLTTYVDNDWKTDGNAGGGVAAPLPKSTSWVVPLGAGLLVGVTAVWAYNRLRKR